MRPMRFVLNQRQLELLRRIATGDDPVTSAEPALATTVYALRGRGLVTVVKPRGQDGRWTAQPTEAGRFFAAHGHHPDDPRQTRTPAPRARASRPAPLDPGQMLAQLHNAGPVSINGAAVGEVTRWRSAVTRARRAGLVPAGQRLTVARHPDGGITVALAATPPARPAPPPVEGPDQPRTLSGAHPLILTTRDKAEHVGQDAAGRLFLRGEDVITVEVTRPLLPRALLFLHALTLTAQRNGFRLQPGRAFYRDRPGPAYTRGGQAVGFRLSELADRRPHAPTSRELTAQRRGRPVWIPPYDHIPSGRLQLELGSHLLGVRRKFTDGKRRRLEQQIETIVQALVVITDTEQTALTGARQEEEEREQRRREALAEARSTYLGEQFDLAVLEQLEAWRTARELRAMAAQIVGRDEPLGTDSQQWCSWALNLADRLDPPQSALRLPEVVDPPEWQLLQWLAQRSDTPQRP